MNKSSKLVLKASLATMALAAAISPGFVYLASERYLRNVSVSAGFVATGLDDPQVAMRGKHIARTRGCFGCHGQQLEGRDFSAEWVWVKAAVAPNLARYAREHEPAVIEAAVRQGVGHDGKALWSMPSYNYALLSDEDMSALIAFLAKAPVVDVPLPRPELGWVARFRIVRGQAQHMAEWADQMPALQFGSNDDPRIARGEYLARTTCNECHGFDLRGQVDIDQSPPDLAILAAYSDADFARLMATGEAIGGRKDLGLMTVVAKDRFASFTDEELADLLHYLRTLPAAPVNQDASWRNLR